MDQLSPEQRECLQQLCEMNQLSPALREELARLCRSAAHAKPIDRRTFLKMTEGFPRFVVLKDRPRFEGLEEFLRWCKQLPPEEQPRSFLRDYWKARAAILAQGATVPEAEQEAGEKAKAFA